MRIRTFYLLCLIRVVTGIFITSPNISTAWDLSAPHNITWIAQSRDTPQVDIYAIWWNSTNGNNSIPESFLGNYSLTQTSRPLAFGIATQSQIWTGFLPSQVPPNYFISLRFVTSGEPVDSDEFITYNNKSTVTALPFGGIRTNVPTLTVMNTTRATVTMLQTITNSFTATTTPPPNPPSKKIPIISGVVGGVGGLLLGGLAGALFVSSRRPQNKAPSFTNFELVPPLPRNSPPPEEQIAAAEQQPLAPDIVTARPTSYGGQPLHTPTVFSPTWPPNRPEGRPNSNSPSPELRARWTGGTRYEQVEPDEIISEYQGPRRIATLEFRPRPEP